MKRNALATQSASAVAKAVFGAALQGGEGVEGDMPRTGGEGWLAGRGQRGL